ncbi:MAG: gamma-glutamyl-gamma-aminobutyrate hydrolase family protein [Nitrospirae bacterium]|nr:gamma-glutamyl-gamma-aminobutyrate hydrolase family protein [Candidatus Manganitrophaceae bacterium]
MSTLIGITTYGRGEENRFYLPAPYVDAVRRAGGIPLLIPPGAPDLKRVIDRIDGLILTGGGDLDPSLYGGVRHPTIYSVDPERDRSEIMLVKQSLDARLPTFGICRGSQVINVALGGTLVEHLPDFVGEAVPHRLPPREPTTHSIQLAPESHLAEILIAEAFVAPSWHHQAVRRLAPGLKSTAQAPDGTIEAVEHIEHPWLIGVQWHPELAAEKDPLQQRLFDALVKAAADRRRK